MTNEVSEPQRALQAMPGPFMIPGANILAQAPTTIFVSVTRNRAQK